MKSLSFLSYKLIMPVISVIILSIFSTNSFGEELTKQERIEIEEKLDTMLAPVYKELKVDKSNGYGIARENMYRICSSQNINATYTNKEKVLYCECFSYKVVHFVGLQSGFDNINMKLLVYKIAIPEYREGIRSLFGLAGRECTTNKSFKGVGYGTVFDNKRILQ